MTPRWYRRLPEAAKNLPPDAYDHCAAVAEVMTPDAVLRDIACGKKREGHGRWHLNGCKGVVWRGKWKRPTYMAEHIDNEAKAFSAHIDGLDYPLHTALADARKRYIDGRK